MAVTGTHPQRVRIGSKPPVIMVFSILISFELAMFECVGLAILNSFDLV
jgi:hypothetical protein